MKGVLLGHSFVKGLYDHLHYINASHTLSSQSIAYALRLSNVSPSIDLLGYRGASTTSILRSANQTLKSIHPDFVIIDLGSNDLKDGQEPLSVAARLIELANHLISSIQVKVVVLCSALPRGNPSTCTHLYNQIYRFNGYLKNFCAVESRIVFWLHKGFWQKPISAWSRDSVHPNTHLGRHLYKRSIRAATFRAVQMIG